MEELLKKIQCTNPNMTKEKLMEELRKSNYSTIAILISMENKKGNCTH
jgi:hypothetical protein